MANSKGFENTFIICPFCFNPLPFLRYMQPADWICPVCKTPDSEWNPMCTCANCAYGHRLIECPHCKEDFDSMRMLGDYGPDYMDFMSIDKYDGPEATYRFTDLNHTFLLPDAIDEDTKKRIIGLLSDVTFRFPGHPGQIRTIQLLYFQADKSVENKVWLCTYLYDRDDIKTNTNVGQIVFVFTAENRMQVHSVVDVSRNFIFKNEKHKEELGQRPLKATRTKYNLTNESAPVAEPTSAKEERIDDLAQQKPKKSAKKTIPSSGRKRKGKSIIGAATAVLLLVLGFVALQNRNGNVIRTLQKPSEQVSVQQIGYITANVHLRTGPGIGNAVVGILKKNTRAVFIDTMKANNGVEWYHVKVESGPLTGKLGYVNHNYWKLLVKK